MSWHLTVPSHQQAQCWLHYQNRIIFKVSLSIKYFYVHVSVHQHMKLHINLSTSPYKCTLDVKYNFLPILPPNWSSLPPCIYHQYKYPPVNTYNPYIDWLSISKLHIIPYNSYIKAQRFHFSVFSCREYWCCKWSKISTLHRPFFQEI